MRLDFGENYIYFFSGGFLMVGMCVKCEHEWVTSICVDLNLLFLRDWYYTLEYFIVWFFLIDEGTYYIVTR